MRKILVTTLLAFPLAVFAAPNLVTNGSFETGLSGWTQGGVVGGGFPVVAIDYGAAQPYPTGAFGEAVPVDNAAGNISPDAAGKHAAYFVDDNSTNESLSQSVFLTAGSYQIGFDAYAPQNGYNNGGDASFSGVVAGVTLASYNVSQGPATQWQHFSGIANIAADGNYNVAFTFNTFGGYSKDIVIDRVYITTAPVPEPETYALMLAGLGALAFVARRRKA